MGADIIEFPQKDKDRCDCGWPFPKNIYLDPEAPEKAMFYAKKYNLEYNCPTCGTRVTHLMRK